MTERIIETIGCDRGDKWREVSILTPRGELQRSEPVKTTRQGDDRLLHSPASSRCHRGGYALQMGERGLLRPCYGTGRGKLRTSKRPAAVGDCEPRELAGCTGLEPGGRVRSRQIVFALSSYEGTMSLGMASVKKPFGPQVALFKQRGGALRMAEALRLGINRKTLYSMRDAGVVEPISRGLFRLASLEPLRSLWQ